jgi:hypothetical protein
MLSKEEQRMVKWAVRMHAKNLLSMPEAIGCLRDVANVENLSEVLPLLPDDLAASLQDSLVRHPALKAVGYWWSHPKYRFPKNDRFPDPTLLVCPSWCAGERERIAAYLRAGRTYARWRGMSYCRFECGLSDADMGSRCLTDGEWVWPEGLPHYIEWHRVRLPDELVASMRRNDWKLPQDSGQAIHITHGSPDTSFWIAWGRKRREDGSASRCPRRLARVQMTGEDSRPLQRTFSRGSI